MPDGEFRELNIMAFDDKPFYRELIDDEHGTNIYDEAIDRLWQTVQLLEITITAANTHIAFIDLDSELVCRVSSFQTILWYIFSESAVGTATGFTDSDGFCCKQKARV